MRNPAPLPRRAPRPALLLRAILCVLLLPAAACSERTAGAPEQPLAAVAPDAMMLELGGPCVHFTRLQAFLPAEPRGFRRLRATASSGRYGEVTVSEAEQVFSASARYDAATGRRLEPRQLSVRIVDTSLTQRMAEAIRAATRAADVTAEAQGEEARTRPLLHENSVGYLSHDPEGDGRLEAMLLVSERFLVSVTGHGFRSSEDARGTVDAVLQDMELAGMSRLARPSIALQGR